MVTITERAHELEIQAPADIAVWLTKLLVASDTLHYKRRGLLVHDQHTRQFVKRVNGGCKTLAGFLPEICAHLDDEEIPYSIFEKLRNVPGKIELPGIESYDFQEEAVKNIYRHRRGLIWLPTGTGKTEIVFMALRATRRPIRAIILVRSVKLIDEDENSWIPRGERYGFDMGKVHQSKINWKNITVCSLGTIISKINTLQPELEKVDWIFVDECHEATEQTEKVLARCRNAYVRVALSGTPYGKNNIHNMLTRGLYGRNLITMTQEEVHDMGNAPDVEYHNYLLNPAKALARTRVPHVRVKGLRYLNDLTDFRKIYNILVYYNDYYEDIIDDINIEINKRKENGLIFVDFVEHAKELSENTGIPFAFSKDRKIDFNESNLWIVTPFLTSGYDFADIHNIVLAGGMRSFQRLMQRIGRGMRKREKMILRVHDLSYARFLMDSRKHALPFVSKHYNQRIAIIKKTLPHAEHFTHNL